MNYTVPLMHIISNCLCLVYVPAMNAHNTCLPARHSSNTKWLMFCAEAIDIPWGFPSFFNSTGVGSVTIVDANTSRYRDVAAIVGDTITIHWNGTFGGNFSLWQIPTGLHYPATCSLTAVQASCPGCDSCSVASCGLPMLAWTLPLLVSTSC